MGPVYLMIWMAIGAYIIGKKRGKGGLYALLSIPVSLVTYFAVFQAMGYLAGLGSGECLLDMC